MELLSGVECFSMKIESEFSKKVLFSQPSETSGQRGPRKVLCGFLCLISLMDSPVVNSVPVSIAAQLSVDALGILVSNFSGGWPVVNSNPISIVV